MNEFALLLLFLGFGLVVAPIWILVRTYTLKRALETEMNALRRELNLRVRDLQNELKSLKPDEKPEHEPPPAPAPVAPPAALETRAPTPHKAPPTPEHTPQTPEPASAVADSATGGRWAEGVLLGAEREITKEESRPEPRPASEPVRSRSAFEENAVGILRAVWRWIVVGEDTRRENVSVESAVATTWLLRVSIVLIVTGIAFGLQYSIENNYLNEWGRLTLALASGTGLLAWGAALCGRKYNLIGHGLVGVLGDCPQAPSSLSSSPAPRKNWPKPIP